ncbi:helix-turn-helix domain-containing protein [Halopiger aswanensis]|uniref:Putative transcriptional regulator n=1 Tax=Halopiger aswanensis TaxID=148449 RepID=A0A3R7DAG5_9EURY|nr:helix-turn-helix domain-containing protein [Halopiger aswanensis]RKD88057.1 putative transcriptional regulator [Halopiger aswanensis]
MTASDPDLAVYACRSCGEYQFASAPPTCCGDPMTAVDDSVPVESPDEALLMRAVFDISETELEVCRHLMSEGELTVKELTDLVDRDRSVVTRHLNHLSELGMIEKRSRVLADGGRVNVYAHRSAEAVRRQFKLGLYAWMTEAADIVDDLSEDKIERLVAGESDPDSGPVIVERDE